MISHNKYRIGGLVCLLVLLCVTGCGAGSVSRLGVGGQLSTSGDHPIPIDEQGWENLSYLECDEHRNTPNGKWVAYWPSKHNGSAASARQALCPLPSETDVEDPQARGN